MMDIRISVLLLVFAVVGSLAISPDGSYSPESVPEHTPTTTSKSISESLELATKSTTTTVSTPTDLSSSENGQSKGIDTTTSTVIPTTTFMTTTPRLSSTSETATKASIEKPTTVLMNKSQSKNKNGIPMKAENNEEKLENETKPPSSSNGNSDSASVKNPSSFINSNPVDPDYPLNFNFPDNSFWRYQSPCFNNRYYPYNPWYPYQHHYYNPLNYKLRYRYKPRVGNRGTPSYDYHNQHYPGYTPFEIPSNDFDIDDTSTYDPTLSYDTNYYPFNGLPNYPYRNYNNQFTNYYPTRNLNWENNMASAIMGPVSYAAPANTFDSVPDEGSSSASFYSNESSNKNKAFLQPVEFLPKQTLQEQI